MQCDLQLEVPFLRGILVDVPAEQAMPIVFGVSSSRSGSSPAVYAPKPGSGSGINQPRPSGQGTQTAATVAAGVAGVRIDGWLREASERKDANDFDGAIRLLKRSCEEIKRENVLYPVEAFLRLPSYLQQAGKTREAWQEFNKLLLAGYPNQPKDGGRVMIDRAHPRKDAALFSTAMARAISAASTKRSARSVRQSARPATTASEKPYRGWARHSARRWRTN